jgi:hypothetical protein
MPRIALFRRAPPVCWKSHIGTGTCGTRVRQKRASLRDCLLAHVTSYRLCHSRPQAFLIHKRQAVCAKGKQAHATAAHSGTCAAFMHTSWCPPPTPMTLVGSGLRILQGGCPCHTQQHSSPYAARTIVIIVNVMQHGPARSHRCLYCCLYCLYCCPTHRHVHHCG